MAEGWDIVGALVPEGELASKQANFVPFTELVEGTSCQLHETADINSDRTVSWLQETDPDLCLSGGWSQIIDEQVLNVPDLGFLGLHSSRLPEGRGGAPVNWSLIDGADDVWLSLFYYESGVDSGDVLAQESVPVEPRDDIASVFDKLAIEACRLVSSVRSELKADEADPKPQSLSEATYRPRRQPQDGLIEWHRDPSKQCDWIRAQTEPYPGAYTFYEGERLTIWEGESVDVPIDDAEPGEIIDIVAGSGIDVRTGDGAFRLTRLRPGNEPSQWADRYARETGLKRGDCLGRHHAPEGWLYTGIRGVDSPTIFETNLALGETGEVEFVVFAASSQYVTVSLSLGGNVVFEDSRTVTDEYRKRVGYTPTQVGTHSITVRFKSEGSWLDTRYLNVFVHDM
jgi:methionyl-tRNA formyltransferase